ncbi:MAG: Bug family tripartite tricarboxylate transporter substrate binding protein [Ramlibacter sp.]
MRKFIWCLAVLAAAVSMGAASAADAFPSKPVRLVVNLAVGGPADLMARIFAEHLQAKIGQPVVVDALPGANGLIGAQAVARAAPDGHTVLFTVENVVTITPLVQDKLPFNPRTDLVPFSLVGTFEQVLVVNPNKGVRTLPELVAKARAQPVTYASAGVGSPGHLAFLALAQRAGFSATHVAYKGGAPAVNDLLGGQVDVGFLVIGGARQHLKAGKLLALATSGKERSPELPDVPTLADAGYPGFQVTYAYFGMLPKGASPQVTAWWQERFHEMLADPKMLERLKAFDTRVVNGDGASARAWIEQSSSRWKAALAGQKLD